MRGPWTQPSLSRDFALLSAAILFILCLISAWLTYSTYRNHAEQISRDMENETQRIEQTLSNEMENANYMLTALGKQIALDRERDLTKLAQLFKSFDRRHYIYTLFSWITPEQKLAISSNKGVLDEPIDVADRDYVKKAYADPWKMIIGRPVDGRASERWVIPAAMGIADYTGKFLGTIMISVDINMLTEQVSNLVRRDGVSFAILSKTLIPLTQVSDDPDFVTTHFPIRNLANINFSTHPRGLIAQGSPLWGTGNYSFYHVSADYPYIILLSYDARHSDRAVHNLLWSRLAQMLTMAMFFVMFLWLVRIRMIKPVLDMTAITASLAKGEAFTALPGGGPVEIAGLAGQIRRVSEYIEENKRIEDELRNKMFMLKRAKEQAELDRRSQSEFLAYVCQEMRTPLNNIIGGAQVMKDQLYGPLENRKYRQYAADIYATGNILMDSTQDLLTLAKAETDYIDLVEKQVDVAAVINRALRFVADKMQAEKLGVKVQLQDALPRLVADEFRLQQILMNLLLHALGHGLPDSAISLEARTVSEHRDRMFFAFVITSAAQTPYAPSELLALAEKLSRSPAYRPAAKVADLLRDQTDISLELARTLATLHHAHIDIRVHGGDVAIVLLFPGNRIRFVESA